MRFLHALAFSAALLVTAGCHSATTEDRNALVLRTYEVPKGSARAVVSTLSDMFWLGENQARMGRAAITPDGRLSVLASENVQTGVQTLVDEITKHPPNYDQSVELHYFVILGKPGASTAPAGVRHS